MHIKASSSDWSNQFEQQYIVEEESDGEDLDEKSDFSEYLWMENEEEFDQRELERLEDEDRMQECLDAMLHDELEAQMDEWEKLKCEELCAAFSSLAVSDCNVENSLLNPLAAEFIPQSHVVNLDFSKS